jgi:hypothetical protein
LRFCKFQPCPEKKNNEVLPGLFCFRNSVISAFKSRKSASSFKDTGMPRFRNTAASATASLLEFRSGSILMYLLLPMTSAEVIFTPANRSAATLGAAITDASAQPTASSTSNIVDRRCIARAT